MNSVLILSVSLIKKFQVEEHRSVQKKVNPKTEEAFSKMEEFVLESKLSGIESDEARRRMPEEVWAKVKYFHPI